MTDFSALPPGLARPGFGEPPIGSVMAYAGQIGGPPGTAGTSAPIEAWGWMLCDGRALSIYQYPQLFAALGCLYTPQGAGDQFNLPDYRGTFLRGTDDGRGMDPDAAWRTPAPQGAPSGVGSTQGSALQHHAHAFQQAGFGGGSEPGPAPGATPPQSGVTGPPISDGDSRYPPGISPAETRPANIYVNYIIKFAHTVR
ncbi:MAG: phage tail protein [Pseudomonadota bacterium]